VTLLEREALAEAYGAVDGGAARTRLPVVVNADSLATWFVAALARVPAELAASFDVRQDDEDHTAELLREGAVMAGVTAQREPVQGCRVRRLGAMRYRALAAPALVARWFPDGLTAEALARAPMLVFDRKDRIQHRFVRLVTGRDLDPPVHHVPSVPAFSEAIRRGLAWGLVPERLAEADLASGACVHLDPDRHVDVPLYWQHWRLESRVLGALTEAVRAEAAVALR
jgi:LysR family transcriptional regulator (chromosome initiation inhibitor)